MSREIEDLRRKRGRLEADVVKVVERAQRDAARATTVQAVDYVMDRAEREVRRLEDEIVNVDRQIEDAESRT